MNRCSQLLRRARRASRPQLTVTWPRHVHRSERARRVVLPAVNGCWTLCHAYRLPFPVCVVTATDEAVLARPTYGSGGTDRLPQRGILFQCRMPHLWTDAFTRCVNSPHPAECTQRKPAHATRRTATVPARPSGSCCIAEFGIQADVPTFRLAPCDRRRDADHLEHVRQPMPESRDENEHGKT